MADTSLHWRICRPLCHAKLDSPAGLRDCAILTRLSCCIEHLTHALFTSEARDDASCGSPILRQGFQLTDHQSSAGQCDADKTRAFQVSSFSTHQKTVAIQQW